MGSTGPISGVSAGQYIMGLILQYVNLIAPDFYKAMHLDRQDPGEFGEAVVRWGSVLLSVAVTVYFYRQNLKGIHESSDKAMKIMYATTAMAAIVIVWCVVTLVIRGPAQSVPFWPDLNAKVEHEEVPAKQAADPTRYTPQEDAVWIRNPDRPDRLEPVIERDENGVKTYITARKAAELVKEMTGSAAPIVQQPLPVDDPKVRQPDITRARTLLGWEPKVSLADGLTKTIEYFRRTML